MQAVSELLVTLIMGMIIAIPGCINYNLLVKAKDYKLSRQSAIEAFESLFFLALILVVCENTSPLMMFFHIPMAFVGYFLTNSISSMYLEKTCTT